MNHAITAVAFAVVMPLAFPAAAADSTVWLDPALQRPADSGKPLLPAPPPASAAPELSERCLPALPCGTRLFGTVQRNGAVEVRVPALRW